MKTMDNSQTKSLAPMEGTGNFLDKALKKCILSIKGNDNGTFEYKVIHVDLADGTEETTQHHHHVDIECVVDHLRQFLYEDTKLIDALKQLLNEGTIELFDYFD